MCKNWQLEYASVVWNNLTLADSTRNKLENTQSKFANLCCNRFIHPISFCNYGWMLIYLYFKTLYSRRQDLDALFLINAFKNKIVCWSIMDTVGVRVPTKQIRDFYAFNVSNISRLTLQQVASRLQTTCKFLHVCNKHNISLKDTFSFASSYWVTSLSC
jgi:hypothetical protein